MTADSRYYDWSIDAENEALVGPGTRVVRTAAVSSKLARKLGVGCIGMRSLWYHWRALKRLCAAEKPDLLFIPVPPYVPMLLGRLIYDRFHIPYVVDYIDPWVTEYYQRLPRSQRPPKWFLADLLSRTVEPFALRKVAEIVGVSQGTTDGVIERYPWLNASQGSEIPYGGEPGDFEYLRRAPRRQNIFRKDDGLLHISYVGRGGTDMKRALSSVFHSFRSGLETSPELFERVRLHFVGTSYAPDATGRYEVLPLAQECGVSAYVTEAPGRVAYLEALQVLLDSDALLVVGSDSPHYTASKIFPYIMARKPLLAVFHKMSSVVAIVRDTHAGAVVTFDETKPDSQVTDEVGSAFRNLVVSARGCEPSTDWEQFARYTTRAMTARLAGVFDRVIPRNGAG